MAKLFTQNGTKQLTAGSGISITDATNVEVGLDTEAAYQNYSGWGDNETKQVVTSQPISSGKYQVLVTEEAPQTNLTSNTWQIGASDTGFELADGEITAGGAFQVETSGGDADFSSVELLLGLDSDFSDSSNSSRTVTANGNAAITTSEKKFGAGSVYLDGVGDYLQSTAPSLSSGSWTVECWWRTDDVNQQAQTIMAGTPDFYWGILFNHQGNGKLLVDLGQGSSWNLSGDGQGNEFTLGTRTSWSSNTWYHTALVFDGTEYRLYVDGVLDATVSNSGSIGSTTTMRVGLWGQGSMPFKGHIDDVRLTKGVARYTSAFTPPTAAFPDSLPQATTNTWAVATTKNALQINTADWQDLNSMTVTESTPTNSETSFAFSTDGRTTWWVVGSGETTTREIVRNNGGTFQSNQSNSYGSTTWTDASTNTQEGALAEAMTVAANKMSGATVTATADANWPSFANTFDMAMLGYTTDAAANPSVSDVSINYDGPIKHINKTHSYDVAQVGSTNFEVTSPASGGPNNVRVQIRS